MRFEPDPMNERDAIDRQTPLRHDAPMETLTTELLIMPDGQILVHNLTRPFAQLLNDLNPLNEQIQPRADCSDSPFTFHDSRSTSS
jgi:hypothetical protein